jgi:hypothetical protein
MCRSMGSVLMLKDMPTSQENSAIQRADTLVDGWQLWLEWQRTVSPDNAAEIQALETDRDEYLGDVRVIGRRQPDARLDEPIVSVAPQYTKKPLLRTET